MPEKNGGFIDETKHVAKQANHELKHYVRLRTPGWVGGVCAGLAYRLGVATWLVRLLWFAAIWLYGVGAMLYILIWIFAPVTDEVPTDYAGRTGDNSS